MAQGTTADPALADRYGHRSADTRRRLTLIVVAAVLVAAGVGYAAWFSFDSAHSKVSWSEGQFTLVDDGHARLDFDVTTDPGTPVVCTVRMLNGGLTEVGRLDVTAGPATNRTFSVTATVPTFEAATSGTVRACVAEHRQGQ
jgi:Domain of unknown function (DUF4307)